MALTGDKATDEKAMREGIAAIMLDFAEPRGFPADHVHTRRRYVKNNDKWEAVALVPDPDDATQRVMRLLSVETASSSWDRKEWRVTFDLKVGWGFTDERPDNKGNSYDEVTAFAYGLLQSILDGETLGVDDAITVTRVRHNGTRFIPQDAQARPAHVADCAVDAIVEVC